MLQCTNRWRLRVFSIMPRIPEISVGDKWEGPFRFLSTGILRITFVGTGPTEICRSVFDKPVSSLPCFPYVGNSEKEWKMVRVRFLLSGPVRSGNVIQSFPGIIWHSEAPQHVINTILRHYVRFLIFWRESFEIPFRAYLMPSLVRKVVRESAPFLTC